MNFQCYSVLTDILGKMNNAYRCNRNQLFYLLVMIYIRLSPPSMLTFALFHRNCSVKKMKCVKFHMGKLSLILIQNTSADNHISFREIFGNAKVATKTF